MTLGNLLFDIRSMYRSSGCTLSPYTYIPEVESFLKRRGEDLKEFERLVGSYNLSDSVITVHLRLKERGVPTKFYGICMKGEAYFAIPKKVEKLVIAEKHKEAVEFYANLEKEENAESEDRFDKNYAIPDELSEEQFKKVFGDDEE